MNRSRAHVSVKQVEKPDKSDPLLEELSTFTLLRLLSAAPGDSAEHRAIQKEIQRRELKPRTHKTVILHLRTSNSTLPRQPQK